MNNALRTALDAVDGPSEALRRAMKNCRHVMHIHTYIHAHTTSCESEQRVYTHIYIHIFMQAHHVIVESRHAFETRTGSHNIYRDWPAQFSFFPIFFFLLFFFFNFIFSLIFVASSPIRPLFHHVPHHSHIDASRFDSSYDQSCYRSYFHQRIWCV